MLRELIPPDLIKEQSPDDWKRVSYSRLFICLFIYLFIYLFILLRLGATVYL